MASNNKNFGSKLKSKSKLNNNSKLFKNVIENFQQLSSKYDNFIFTNEDSNKEFKSLTKCLYDCTQKLLNDMCISIPSKSNEKPLKTLLIDNLDNEQVWQQLEIFNQTFVDYSIKEISRLSSLKIPILLNVDMDTKEKETVKSILKSNIDHTEEKKKVNFSIDNKNDIKNNDPNKNNLPNNNNIDFFDLKEMEQFLDEQENDNIVKNGTNDEDKNIDYFTDIPYDDFDDDEDIEENDVMYGDFFDPPKLQSNISEQSENIDDENYDDSIELDTRDYNLSDGDNSEDEDLINKKLKALANEQNDSEDELFDKSEYEKSQIKLQKKIKKAEEELLLPHNLKWQLSGETTSSVRPANSLLEEHLQFDHVSRPVPLITDETTCNLEGIIKQRIKDKVFDDVERKIKPKEEPFEFRKRILLESEKSKIGLAEVYEQEYLKQQQKRKEQELGVRTDSFIVAGEAEESETRKEIRSTIRLLFRKLDSLSTFHYTPRPPEPEIKIINNLPTITVEEAVPDAVSDMKLLAPEEVFSTRNRKVLQDKGERTKTDKKRARRLKKKKQSIKQQFIQNKLKLKSNQNEFKKKSESEINDDSKHISSSTKFFERLQEKKETHKIEKKTKPKIIPGSNFSKKLKL